MPGRGTGSCHSCLPLPTRRAPTCLDPSSGRAAGRHEGPMWSRWACPPAFSESVGSWPVGHQTGSYADKVKANLMGWRDSRDPSQGLSRLPQSELCPHSAHSGPAVDWAPHCSGLPRPVHRAGNLGLVAGRQGWRGKWWSLSLPPHTLGSCHGSPHTPVQSVLPGCVQTELSSSCYINKLRIKILLVLVLLLLLLLISLLLIIMEILDLKECTSHNSDKLRDILFW